MQYSSTTSSISYNKVLDPHVFIKGPGEGCHEGPPSSPRGKAHKETPEASVLDGGNDGVLDVEEGLGTHLHARLDDIGRLSGRRCQESSHQTTW